MRLIPELLVLAVSMLLIAGCGESPATSNGDSQPSAGDVSDSSEPAAAREMVKPMMKPGSEEIVFKDDVESNAEIPDGLQKLVFTDMNNQPVALKDYLGSKNIVLVFTEGFAGGMLCPFCITQTARLVANYDKFKALNTEVLVVYPGSRDHLDEFVEAATMTEKDDVDRVPFPLLLDQEMAAVGFFNIASNLAHPSTFIIDREDNIRLAYVGADKTADRPSIAAMLKIITEAEKSFSQESSDAASNNAN